VAVEKSLGLEELQQVMSEAMEELKDKLEQIERERNILNTENEELAKRT
jgi:regulator of replication initiation timing